MCIRDRAVYAGWFSDESAGQPSDVLPSLIVLLVFMPVLLVRELVRHYCFAHSENTSVLGIDLAISVLQIVALLCFGYFEILSGATICKTEIAKSIPARSCFLNEQNSSAAPVHASTAPA